MTRACRRLLALPCLLAACATGDQFRGHDHRVAMPAARAQWQLRPPKSPTNSHRVRFTPVLEGDVAYVDGSFPQSGQQVDYAVTSVHAAFVPALAWNDAVLMPIGGVGWGRIEVDAAADGVTVDEPGLVLGGQLAWRGLAPLEPYVRYTSLAGIDVGVRRFEAGVDLRIAGPFGLQVAYSRQTAEAEEFDAVFLTTFVDAVRIESEGVHLAMSLRF